MGKLLYLLASTAILRCANAQQLSPIIGLQHNSYFSKDAQLVTQRPGFGCVVGIGLTHDSLYPLLRNSSAAIQYYEGGIRAISTGHGGSLHNGLDVQRKCFTFSFALMPITATLFHKRLRLLAGLEAGVLLQNTTTGTIYEAQKYDSLPPNYTGSGYYNTSREITKKDADLNSSVTFGFTTGASWKIVNRPSCAMIIWYNFYFGLTPEIWNDNTYIRSLRHRAGLGLEIPLKPQRAK